MKIIGTQEALEHLMEIEDYIAKDNPERAAKFVDEIIERAESTLPDSPRIGRTVPEISNPEIRELIFKKYHLVYRVHENNSEILTVFEGYRLLRIEEIGL